MIIGETGTALLASQLQLLRRITDNIGGGPPSPGGPADAPGRMPASAEPEAMPPLEAASKDADVSDHALQDGSGAGEPRGEDASRSLAGLRRPLPATPAQAAQLERFARDLAAREGRPDAARAEGGQREASPSPRMPPSEAAVAGGNGAGQRHLVDSRATPPRGGEAADFPDPAADGFRMAIAEDAQLTGQASNRAGIGPGDGEPGAASIQAQENAGGPADPRRADAAGPPAPTAAEPDFPALSDAAAPHQPAAAASDAGGPADPRLADATGLPAPDAAEPDLPALSDAAAPHHLAAGANDAGGPTLPSDLRRHTEPAAAIWREAPVPHKREAAAVDTDPTLHGSAASASDAAHAEETGIPFPQAVLSPSAAAAADDALLAKGLGALGFAGLEGAAASPMPERAGVIASFILNAHFLPGWPPPRPIELPAAVAAQPGLADILARLNEDELEKLAYLAKLGLTPAQIERLALLALRARRRSKFFEALAVILTNVTAVLDALRDEAAAIVEEAAARHALAVSGDASRRKRLELR